MKTLLWFDDCRDPIDDEVDWMVFSCLGRDCEVIWVKNYNEFTFWVKENGLPDGINFDHDLADISLKEEKTGYDCAKWLVDYCLETNNKIPTYYVHSANPIGTKNIISYLENAKKHI